MCREAAEATTEMQYGRAMRIIEGAIKIADEAKWIDAQGLLVRAVVREAGGRLATLRGDLSEAIDLFGQSITIRAEIFGLDSKETQQVKAMKAESLADMGNMRDSLALWNEVVEWADSKQGTALARVSTRLSRSRVLFEAGYERGAIREVDEALSLMDKVPAERAQVLAEDLLDQAGKFERLGNFPTAHVLMKHAISLLEARLGGTPADAVELEAFRLELAKLAAGAGHDEEARTIFQSLLQNSATIKGDGHPDTMDIREAMAVAAFERGDFTLAEVSARRNFELAIQAPEARDLLQRGLTLNWLYEKMGRLKAANETLHEMHGVLGGMDRIRPIPGGIDGPQYISVSELVKGLKAGVDMNELLDQAVPELPAASRLEVKAGLMTAMATELVVHDRDIPLAESVLGEVEHILLALPPHLQDSVLEDAEKARIAISIATKDAFQEVSLKEAQLTRFEREFGVGRGMTYASMLKDLAEAYHRAGDNDSAFERLKEARMVLRHYGATKSFIYGKVLQQKAAVLPEWDDRVEKYRERAARILKRFAGE